MKDFGAVGDGVADDTDAIIKAIAKVDAGAILIPAGRYKITRVIQIKKSNIVLARGRPGAHHPGVSEKSGGNLRGSGIWCGLGLDLQRRPYLGWNVGEDLQKGGRHCRRRPWKPRPHGLDHGGTQGRTNHPAVHVGRCRKSLNRHIYADEMIGTLPSIRFHSKITAISGNKITLERPLRLNVRTKWSPRILTVSGQVREVGIEGFTMEFPDVPYKGHFKEDGYNGIFLFGSWNCWVRDVTLHNCESGIFLEKSAFCTVDKVELHRDRLPQALPVEEA